MSPIDLPAPERTTSRPAGVMAWLVILGLGLAHGLGCWIGSGGWGALRSDWPIAQHDHPVHFHSASVAGGFLHRTLTNAGYDPSFMAGYPKTVLFPQSSTLFDVVAAVVPRERLPQAFKLTVLVAVAALPWLVALASLAFGFRSEATAFAVALALLFAWTEGGGAGFPLNFAMYGMTAYFVAVPLGLVACGTLAAYLERGGGVRWLLGALASSLTLLAHALLPLVLLPMALASYAAAIATARRRRAGLLPSRHLGFWLIGMVTLAVNAFWWWPGLWFTRLLRSVLPAFYHPEPVWQRLVDIARQGLWIQPTLCLLLVPGLVALARSRPAAAGALGGFTLAGFAWGYLAGAFRALDTLQPGRQTYAFYLGAALLGGLALATIRERLSGWRARPDLLFLAVLLGGAWWGFGADVQGSVRYRLGWSGAPPFLNSRPTDRLKWLVASIRRHLEPGDRLLYEEGGRDLDGIPDPYQGGRFSGLLPYLTGVEVLGGPYLMVSLKTNFTQFGEGRLFERADWDEAFFRRYAAIYRPTAIVCWSPKAVAFCQAHPDLIEILDVQTIMLPVLDARTGRPVPYRSQLLFARVKGYGGATIRGEARVRAEPGRLVIEPGAHGDELDGLVVLRYHSVPWLRSQPPVPLEAVTEGDDPVPFIGLRPPPEGVTIELHWPP